MPVAILDFGTNTFNLLIAEKQNNSFEILYTGKQGVKLGKGGIQKNNITIEAMDRGMNAIAAHMKTIAEYHVNDIHAYATSAIRNAANGHDFVTRVKDTFGFYTRVIDGEREAELIYKGISASVDFGDDTAMILDIGGGSNEFIICNKTGILWKHSFELGMARLIEKFTLSDPIREDEIAALKDYFRDELALLLENVHTYRPGMLVGASGSFDTIAAMIRHRFPTVIGEPASPTEIPLDHYAEIHRLLLKSTADERLHMPGMEPVRVEMIVPATIFITFVLENCGLTKLVQSSFALKEGVMTEIINQ